MIVSLIVAMDEAGGIGKNHRLPWHLSSDLRRFKALTMGHHIAMGRATYETIGKPLPGRIMIIITHRRGYHPEGCQVVDSIESAIRLAKGNHETELFIIGGGQVFNQAIGIADKIYLTTVLTRVDADVFFPRIDLTEWTPLAYEEPVKNEQDDYRSDFRILIRNKVQ